MAKILPAKALSVTFSWAPRLVLIFPLTPLLVAGVCLSTSPSPLSLTLSNSTADAVHFIRRIYYIIPYICPATLHAAAPSPRRLETLTTFQRRRLIIRKLGSPPPVRPLVLYCPELNSHMTDGCCCGCSASSTARKGGGRRGTSVEYKKYMEEVVAAGVGLGEESRSEKEKKIKSQT